MRIKGYFRLSVIWKQQNTKINYHFKASSALAKTASSKHDYWVYFCKQFIWDVRQGCLVMYRVYYALLRKYLHIALHLNFRVCGNKWNPRELISVKHFDLTKKVAKRIVFQVSNYTTQPWHDALNKGGSTLVMK